MRNKFESINKKNEYDYIAKEYVGNISLKRRYCYDHSFYKAIGKVDGKSVLDLACGSGYYTREIKKMGADKVVGVDISEEMIKIAEEENENLGIEYLVCNVSEMPKIGEFDLIIGSFLLHYSKTKEELKLMCNNIFNNLKNRGKFIALNLNPDDPLQPEETHRKYGSTTTTKGELKEGGVVRVKIYKDKDDKNPPEFSCYHWEKKTYEEILSKAGFKNIKFNYPEVSQDGIDKFGEEFWKDFIEHPGNVIIECEK